MLRRACASLPLALPGAYAASVLELHSEDITDTRQPETSWTGRCLPCEGLFARLEEAPNGKLQQSSQIVLRGWVQRCILCVVYVSISCLPTSCTVDKIFFGPGRKVRVETLQVPAHVFKNKLRRDAAVIPILAFVLTAVTC